MTTFRRTKVFSALLVVFSQLLISSTMALDLMVPIWSVTLDQKPYPHKYMVVGDSITFKLFGPHSVWIHPSGNCADTANRFEVGARGSGLAKYIFTEDDVGKSIFFTCGSGTTHCQMGQSLTVSVEGSLDKTPLADDNNIIVSSNLETSDANRRMGNFALSFFVPSSMLGWLLLHA